MIGQVFLLGANHLLGRESWARRALLPHAGRSIRLVVPPIDLVLMVTADGLLAEAAAQEIDVELRLPVPTPWLALQGREALLRQVHISGAADFAQVLGELLQHLRWDYEEDLSRVFGDVVAHRIAAGVRQLAGWPRGSARNLAENIAEFLREEQPLLVSRQGLADFGASLSELDSALLEIDARLRRIENSRGQV